MKKIVFMGDSLTEGYGVLNSERFTELFKNYRHIEVINSGISGDTTVGMLARFHEMVIKYNPSHVFIMGGSNDVYLQVHDRSIISNILAMMRYAKYHGIEVIIGIPTPIFEGDLAPSIVYLNPKPAQKALKQYRNLLIQFCIEEDLEYIDLYEGFQNEWMTSDGLHPNEKGHLWIFEQLKKLM